MMDLLESMMDVLEANILLVRLLILGIWPILYIAFKIKEYYQLSYFEFNFCLLSLATTLGLIGRFLLNKNIIYIIITAFLLSSLSYCSSFDEYDLQSLDTGLDENLLVIGISSGVFFLLYIWFFYVFL